MLSPVCVLHTAVSLPSPNSVLVPAQSSSFFEEWLATFDPNTPVSHLQDSKVLKCCDILVSHNLI